MADRNTAAFGIFPSHSAAEAAVDRLRAAGFSNDDVSVLMADKQGSKDFAAEKNTKAPEGTTAGVLGGGTLGGTLGPSGRHSEPSRFLGVGPLIAAGPIMGALAGLGIGGAVGGSGGRAGRHGHPGVRGQAL